MTKSLINVFGRNIMKQKHLDSNNRAGLVFVADLIGGNGHMICDCFQPSWAGSKWPTHDRNSKTSKAFERYNCRTVSHRPQMGRAPPRMMSRFNAEAGVNLIIVMKRLM